MFEELISKFNEFSQNNQLVAGAVSVWALGVGTYILRNYPLKFWKFLVKQFTISVTIHNEDSIYYRFLEWYKYNNYTDQSRYLKIRNHWLNNHKFEIITGPGIHYFWYKWWPFKIIITEKILENDRKIQSTIVLKTFGRSKKKCINLFEDFRKKLKLEYDKAQKSDYFQIYDNIGTNWDFKGSYKKRSFDTLIFNDDIDQQLKNIIDKFINNYKWYLENGIPHRLGILLYGPPGTGKSSIVKALVSHYKKKLLYLHLNITTDESLGKLFSRCDIEEGIILIEDIDTYDTTKSRSNEEEQKNNKSFLTLSGLLNSIDGVTSRDNRIIIATTNHIENLDEALIREGRFDVKIKIDYMNHESIIRYLKRFFPEYQFPKNIKFKNNITPAYLQSMVIKNKSISEIMDNIRFDISIVKEMDIAN